ncbi:MAG TPA: thioredoxin-disulfide reductase [Clostridiaceae bacterium]|jgi:thioredoxin reductase (NADPH)|nr:thioredoxin-disulfide reductase [Clostridiaceae bacterium]
MYDVVIVGGGPAGFTAALYAARAKLDTLLIEKMVSGGQMATTYVMENYPGFAEPISGPDLALRMEKQARRFGAQVLNDTVVDLQLDKVKKEIKTTKDILYSKTVILCMGAKPRELGCPGEKELKGSGVSYCATCDGAFFKDRIVAVVGGGDTAAEDALYLTRFCPKVYLIHRRDSLRATKVLQEAVFSNDKIEVVWDSVVEEIHGRFDVEGIKVKNVKTDESRKIEAEGVFVAIGVVPNTELVKGKVELNQAGYIITDDSMQTNIFGVYAAGDIREKVLRQVITAASDGAVAAYMAERYIVENRW